MNIFIDTQDMEERYGEELYKEYLENQNKEMKEKIDKAIEYIKEDMYGEPNELYGLVDGEHILKILGDKE
jgi:NAD+--asparagine ADP-ribosyltransferase